MGRHCDEKPLDLRCAKCREGAALEAWMAYQLAEVRETLVPVAQRQMLILQGFPEWWTPLLLLWRRN